MADAVCRQSRPGPPAVSLRPSSVGLPAASRPEVAGSVGCGSTESPTPSPDSGYSSRASTLSFRGANPAEMTTTSCEQPLDPVAVRTAFDENRRRLAETLTATMAVRAGGDRPPTAAGQQRPSDRSTSLRVAVSGVDSGTTADDIDGVQMRRAQTTQPRRAASHAETGNGGGARSGSEEATDGVDLLARAKRILGEYKRRSSSVPGFRGLSVYDIEALGGTADDVAFDDMAAQAHCSRLQQSGRPASVVEAAEPVSTVPEEDQYCTLPDPMPDPCQPVPDQTSRWFTSDQTPMENHHVEEEQSAVHVRQPMAGSNHTTSDVPEVGKRRPPAALPIRQKSLSQLPPTPLPGVFKKPEVPGALAGEQKRVSSSSGLSQSSKMPPVLPKSFQRSSSVTEFHHLPSSVGQREESSITSPVEFPPPPIGFDAESRPDSRPVDAESKSGSRFPFPPPPADVKPSFEVSSAPVPGGPRRAASVHLSPAQQRPPTVPDHPSTHSSDAAFRKPLPKPPVRAPEVQSPSQFVDHGPEPETVRPPGRPMHSAVQVVVPLQQRRPTFPTSTPDPSTTTTTLPPPSSPEVRPPSQFVDHGPETVRPPGRPMHSAVPVVVPVQPRRQTFPTPTPDHSKTTTPPPSAPEVRPPSQFVEHGPETVRPPGRPMHSAVPVVVPVQPRRPTFPTSTPDPSKTTTTTTQPPSPPAHPAPTSPPKRNAPIATSVAMPPPPPEFAGSAPTSPKFQFPPPPADFGKPEAQTPSTAGGIVAGDHGRHRNPIAVAPRPGRRPPTGSIETWSTADVGKWLEEKKLGEHRVRFQTEGIDGRRLSTIDRTMMISLGVTQVDQRFLLERELKKAMTN